MITYAPLGDQAVVVTCGKTVHINTHKTIQYLLQVLHKNPFPGMVECVPAFTSLTVYYDLYVLWKTYHVEPFEFVCSYIEKLLFHKQKTISKEFETVFIPVCYGGEYGPDLKEVATYHQMSEEDVIHIHSEASYFIYMLGFTPGFPYLSGLPQQLNTPRKSSPRLKITPGSIGIGGEQTGIYPLETPGGWNIIGRTPIVLFRPNKTPPTYLQSGMHLKFVPIAKKEFLHLEREKNEH